MQQLIVQGLGQQKVKSFANKFKVKKTSQNLSSNITSHDKKAGQEQKNSSEVENITIKEHF